MWTKIEVYNHDSWIGSFYTNETERRGIVKDINEKYGEGKWTRFGIGN
jgi:hypothetical protein